MKPIKILLVISLIFSVVFFVAQPAEAKGHGGGGGGHSGGGHFGGSHVSMSHSWGGHLDRGLFAGRIDGKTGHKHPRIHPKISRGHAWTHGFCRRPGYWMADPLHGGVFWVPDGWGPC